MDLPYLADTFPHILKVSYKSSRDSVQIISVGSERSAFVTQEGCSPGDQEGRGGRQG